MIFTYVFKVNLIINSAYKGNESYIGFLPKINIIVTNFQLNFWVFLGI
jgi:hypothetical protein